MKIVKYIIGKYREDGSIDFGNYEIFNDLRTAREFSLNTKDSFVASVVLKVEHLMILDEI
jgi:hypothetical protein